MLKSVLPHGVSRACALLAQQVYFLSPSPHLSQKYLSLPCSPISCCCAVRSLLLSSPLRTTSRAARLPTLVPHSIPRHAPIPHCAPFAAAPYSIPHRAALARCEPRPSYYVPCSIPAHADVLLGATDAAIPHEKVVAVVDVVATATCDPSKEILR